MALTQEQVDYIIRTTNERGAAHQPPYQFLHTQTFGPDQIWLNIVVEVPPDGGAQGGSRKGPRGWHTDADAFHALVANTITAAERHV